MGIGIGDILNLGAVFLNNGKNGCGKPNTLSLIGTALNIFSGVFGGNNGQRGNIGWPSIFGGGSNKNSAQNVLQMQDNVRQAYMMGQMQIQNDVKTRVLEMQKDFITEKGNLLNQLNNKQITQEQYNANIQSLETQYNLAVQRLEIQAQQAKLALEQNIQNQYRMQMQGINGGCLPLTTGMNFTGMA